MRTGSPGPASTTSFRPPGCGPTPNAAEQSRPGSPGTPSAPGCRGSTEQGTKTVFVRAEAPDVIRFDGTLDRVADSLSILGDPRSKDQRRAAAGSLANPQATLDLFDQTADSLGITLETPPRRSPPGHPRRRHPSRWKRRNAHPNGRSTRGRRPPSTSTSPMRLSPTASTRQHPRQRPRDGAGWDGWKGSDPSPSTGSDLAGQQPGHRETGDRPAQPDPGRRLRDPEPGPRSHPPHLPRRLLPLRHLNQPQRRPRPHHPLPAIPTRVGHPAKPAIGNLGPLTRRHHRTKSFIQGPSTKSGPAYSSWRSPHGHRFPVDHTGTSRAQPWPTAA